MEITVVAIIICIFSFLFYLIFMHCCILELVTMSYLSNYVKELFVHVFSQSSHKLESFSPLPLQIALSNFDKELRFVFDEDFSMDMQTEEECLNVVNCLSKVFFMTNQITYSTEEVERLSKLIPSWLYSTNEEQIVKWFQTTLNEAEQQLYLLQITSSLEFALGNVSDAFVCVMI